MSTPMTDPEVQALAQYLAHPDGPGSAEIHRLFARSAEPENAARVADALERLEVCPACAMSDERCAVCVEDGRELDAAHAMERSLGA